MDSQNYIHVMDSTDCAESTDCIDSMKSANCKDSSDSTDPIIIHGFHGSHGLHKLQFLPRRRGSTGRRDGGTRLSSDRQTPGASQIP